MFLLPPKEACRADGRRNYQELYSKDPLGRTDKESSSLGFPSLHPATPTYVPILGTIAFAKYLFFVCMYRCML